MNIDQRYQEARESLDQMYTHSIRQMEADILNNIRQEDTDKVILEEVEDLLLEVDNILDCIEDTDIRKLRETITYSILEAQRLKSL